MISIAPLNGQCHMAAVLNDTIPIMIPESAPRAEKLQIALKNARSEVLKIILINFIARELMVLTTALSNF